MSNITKCGQPLRVQECTACDGLGLPPPAENYSDWMQYPDNIPVEWCNNGGMLFNGNFGDKEDVYFCSFQTKGNAATSCADLPQLQGYQPWQSSSGVCMTDDGFGGGITSLGDIGSCCAVPVAKKQAPHQQRMPSTDFASYSAVRVAAAGCANADDCPSDCSFLESRRCCSGQCSRCLYAWQRC
jgi:hypothetical protein